MMCIVLSLYFEKSQRVSQNETLFFLVCAESMILHTMSVIQRLQKAVAAFVNTFTEAATEDKAEGHHSGLSESSIHVLSREDVYLESATDTPSHETRTERQGDPGRVETGSKAYSEDSETSPSPLQALDAVSLHPMESSPNKEVPHEVTLLYAWSPKFQKDVIAPSMYGYQFTDDKRAAQSHNDRGTVSVAYIDEGNFVKTIDLKGESDLLLSDDILVAKRQGYDTLVARNVSDGERIYDRYIVFNPAHVHMLSFTSYEQDLQRVLPTLRGISVTEPMQGTDCQRGIEFVMEDEGGELLVNARLDKEGRIISARASDESYERLEMFIGKNCDAIFGEGSWQFFQEHPYCPYEPGDQQYLNQHKIKLLDKICGESWRARLANPVRMSYPDRVHTCHWIHYLQQEDVLALGEWDSSTAKVSWFPLFPENLSTEEIEVLDKVHDFYLKLEDLRSSLKETVVSDCLEEVTQFLFEAEHVQKPETVKGLEAILQEYDVIGNDPEILCKVSVLRQFVGLPSADWQTFPSLDGDEMDWLSNNKDILQRAEGSADSLPSSLAEKFPELQRLSEKGTREEYLDLLGHVQTMAYCKWSAEEGFVEYSETETVWEGDKAKELWNKCVEETNAIEKDSQTVLNPELRGFRGVARQADSYWQAYRYDQPGLQLYIDKEPFMAYAFAKGSMTQEQLKAWKQEIQKSVGGLEFHGGIKANVSLDMLYLKVSFEKNGLPLGRYDLGASSLESVMPLHEHLEKMAASLEQVWNNERIPEEEQEFPFYPSEEAVGWSRIFPKNYGVTLENEHQWKMLTRYQEAKGIVSQYCPEKFPAACMIDPTVKLAQGQSPILIDMGDFVMGSYLQTTPRAELQELLSRFQGVLCTDCYEIHLDRPQRVFDETGVRYYHTLIGKEGNYRLMSHRHDGNVPIPSYMNRQLLIDTLRTCEKQMCLRNKEVNAVLRWGVDIEDRHYGILRMDDGLFYLTDEDRRPLGKGVELAAADDRFEEAMCESLHTPVRCSQTTDYSDIYELMQESHIRQLFLSDSIPVMQGGSIIGVRMEIDLPGNGNNELVPLALIGYGHEKTLTYPISLLSPRTQHALERALYEDYNATLHGREIMGGVRLYKDASGIGMIPASDLSGALLAELNSKGIDCYEFSRPFDIKDGANTYHFSAIQQVRLNEHPSCAFRAQCNGMNLVLPVSHLPERIALQVVNESLCQLDQVDSLISVPKDISLPGKEFPVMPTSDSNLLISNEMDYTADCMMAYGIEAIHFDAPLKLGDTCIHGVAIEGGLVEVEIRYPQAAQSKTIVMTELKESEVSALMEQCLDAVYSGQTESYRNELTERSLRDILLAGPEKIEVDLPEYGIVKLFVQRDHVMLDIPKSESRDAFVLPWLALDSMDIKASLEEQVRRLPFDSNIQRVLYEDQNGKLSVQEGRFLLEGQVQTFDLTTACRELQEAGVNLNQASRESLSAFCHRHKAIFVTDHGNLTAQLYRSYNEYELKLDPPQKQSQSNENEPVL